MSITKHFDARLFEAQELIDKQTDRHAADLDRIAELEAAHTEALEMVCDAMEDAAKLRLALSEVREVWAGSEGLMPQTDRESRLVIQCYDIAVEALKK